MQPHRGHDSQAENHRSTVVGRGDTISQQYQRRDIDTPLSALLNTCLPCFTGKGWV